MSKMYALWLRIMPVLLLFFVVAAISLNTPRIANAQTPAPAPAPAPAAEGGEVSDESCESLGGDFSFGLCPLLRMSNEGIQLLDQKIRSSLEVNPKYFEAIDNLDSPRNGEKPIQKIWATFRNIAAILLIPILLVLVIGTALGFSVVDAYTVKRAMPRLFIAVIFMALSYDICLIMIDVTTALGRGIGGIVAAPFGGVNNLTLPAIFMPPTELPGAGGGGGGGITGFAKNIISAGASAPISAVKLIPGADEAFAVAGGLVAAMSLSAASIVSIAILASFFFVGLVLMLVIFGILAVRELVIVFLVVISPLAILSWIFPGNDKLWKIWWDTFTKLLMVYPVIFGLLMLGRGFASMINDVGATIDPGSIEMVFFVITKLIVYVGPFFMLLFVLKILTGAFGTFTGMVNDKRRGFFDRQRNYRQGKRKALRERTVAGVRYKQTGIKPLDNALKSVNSGLAFSTQAKHAGINPMRMRSRMNAANNIRTERVAKEFSEKDEFFNYYAEDDNVLGAAFEARKSGSGEFKKRLIAKGDDRFASNVVTDTNGNVVSYTQNAEQKRNLENVTTLQEESKNRVGVNEFGRASIQRLAKDGTYFNNAMHLAESVRDVYGEDRQAAGAAMMQAAGASLNSGRGDIGAAGAGAKLGLLSQAYAIKNDVNAMVNLKDESGNDVKDASGKTIQVKLDQKVAQRMFIEQVLRSQPASTLVHPSMKSKYIQENIVPVLQDRLETKSRNMGATAAGTAERAAAENAYVRELAMVDNFHQSLLGSSPDLAKLVGDTIMSKQFDPNTVGRSNVEKIPQYDQNGAQVGETERLNTVRQEINRYKNSDVYQNYHKEFQAAEDTEIRRRAAGQAAQAQAGATPPPPIAPLTPPR